VNAFWLPKQGNTAEEYEDAYSLSENSRLVAVADGATESSFAELWAQGLVSKFTHAPPPVIPPAGEPLKEWVTPLQKEWHASIKWDSLPWFAEEKARSGAFATFIGLKFAGGEEEAKPSFMSRLFSVFNGKRNEVQWNALAVGDSNLFIIRDNLLLKAFPFVQSEQFNSRPLLLSSNPSRNAQVWADVKFASGDCKANDLFILATDALAKWFLTQCEAGDQPWRALYALKNAEDFAELVGKLRKQTQIRNDDTTLVILKWVDSPPKN